MRRVFVALLLVLAINPSSPAQAHIKKANRIANREPGYCAWACLTMMGKHQKIKALYDLIDEREKEFTWQWDEHKDEWFKSTFVWTDYGTTKITDPKVIRRNQYVWVWDKKNQKAVRRPFVYENDDGHTMVYEDRSPGGHYALVGKLKRLGVKYRFQDYGDTSRKLIKRAILAEKPCLIVLKVWDRPTVKGEDVDTHAVILLDYNEEGIEFLDPNDIEQPYTAPHEWFDEHFTGYVLILE